MDIVERCRIYKSRMQGSNETADPGPGSPVARSWKRNKEVEDQNRRAGNEIRRWKIKIEDMPTCHAPTCHASLSGLRGLGHSGSLYSWRSFGPKLRTFRKCERFYRRKLRASLKKHCFFQSCVQWVVAYLALNSGTLYK